LTSLALALVLSSCVTHAAWNLIAKRSSRTPAFFWVANVSVFAAVAPAFFTLGGAGIFAAAPARLWMLLALTVAFQTAYFACLAGAYRHGDVSVAYPLVRTTPIFVLLLAGFLMRQVPAWHAVAGIALVVAGCFLVPLERFGVGPGGFRWKAYATRMSLWALAAALASAGYTLVDDAVMDLLRPLAPGLRGAFLYECLQVAGLSVGLFVAALALDGAAGLKRAVRGEKARAAVVGALVFFTYMLVLWAYAEARIVAYVAGLRQLSIVLGVAGGVVLLKEPGRRVRLAASAVIVAGLILIALAR